MPERSVPSRLAALEEAIRILQHDVAAHELRLLVHDGEQAKLWSHFIKEMMLAAEMRRVWQRRAVRILAVAVSLAAVGTFITTIIRFWTG